MPDSTLDRARKPELEHSHPPPRSSLVGPYALRSGSCRKWNPHPGGRSPLSHRRADSPGSGGTRRAADPPRRDHRQPPHRPRPTCRCLRPHRTTPPPDLHRNAPQPAPGRHGTTCDSPPILLVSRHGDRPPPVITSRCAGSRGGRGGHLDRREESAASTGTGRPRAPRTSASRPCGGLDPAGVVTGSGLHRPT